MTHFLLDKAVLEEFLQFKAHGITITGIDMPDPMKPWLIQVFIAGEGLPEGRVIPTFGQAPDKNPILLNIEAVA